MLRTLAERVDPSHTALLIVDLQNDFVDSEGSFAKMGVDVSMFQAIAPRVINLINAARKAEVPVIFVQMIHSRWTNSDAWIQRIRVSEKGWSDDKPTLPYVVMGTWGAEWWTGLSPTETDFVVTKHRYSAFTNTDLDLVLRSIKRKTVVVTGGETTLCLGTTAMDALMHDYYVVLPEDCVAGVNPETHKHGLQILDKFFGIVTTSSEIIRLWES